MIRPGGLKNTDLNVAAEVCVVLRNRRLQVRILPPVLDRAAWGPFSTPRRSSQDKMAHAIVEVRDKRIASEISPLQVANCRSRCEDG